MFRNISQFPILQFMFCSSETGLDFAVVTNQHKLNTVKAHFPLNSQVDAGLEDFSLYTDSEKQHRFYHLQTLHFQYTNGEERLY